LEPELKYLDLCGNIQKILVFALRNETDAMNIQFCLAISSMFCIESAKYSIKMSKTSTQNAKEDDDEFDEQTKSLI
jgi:hypothetical protein